MALYPPLWMQEQTYPALLDRLFIQDALGPAPVLLSGAGAFAVTQNATPNMTVNVGVGRALIPGTDAGNQGSYTVWSDTVVNVPIATAPGAGLSRIDLIVCQVRDDFVIGGGHSDFVIVPVQGVAAATGSQVAPAAPNSSMVCAQVLVGPNVSSIVTANITDMRPYYRAGSTQLVVSRPLSSLVTAGSPYTVNHNLGTTSVIVEIWDTVTGANIQAGVRVVDANNVAISVTANAPNPVNVVIIGTAAAPTTVVPSNLATVAYVQQQMTQSYSFTYLATIGPCTTAGSPYVVNHNLNTTNVFVQVWDSVTQQVVYTQVNIVDVNNISITVAQNMPNAVNVVVMGAGNAPLPISPANLTTKAYVDARTPALPGPVVGTTIQSFTDVLGDIWVAKGSVSSGNWRRARDVVRAKYQLSGSTTISAVQTDLIMNVVNSDPMGCSSGANGGFTAPIPGMYLCTFNANLGAAPAALGYLQNNFKVNGTVVSYGHTTYYPATAAAWPASTITDQLAMNANDLIIASLWASPAQGTVSNANGRTYFSVIYVGPLS